MKQLDDVYRELERVDTKCSALAGLTGAGATYVATKLTEKLGVAVAIPMAAACVFLVAATLILLWTLRPRLGPTGFNRYAILSESQIAAQLRRESDNPVAAAAEHLQVVSRICVRKNRALRRACEAIAAAVIAIAVAAVTAGLT